MIDPILVIGPQRTGSSMMAGILQRLGFDMQLTEGSSNAKYFESNEWLQYCAQICGNWRCPQFHFANSKTLDEMRASIDRPRDGPWAVKSPFFALIGHHVLPLFEGRVGVIRTYRNDEDMVQSLIKREKNMPDSMARFIQGQSLAASLLTDNYLARTEIPVAKIRYEAVLDNPEKAINGMAEYFGIEHDTTDAINFVDRSACHFRAVA